MIPAVRFNVVAGDRWADAVVGVFLEFFHVGLRECRRDADTMTVNGAHVQKALARPEKQINRYLYR